jgi:hypothetical protein
VSFWERQGRIIHFSHIPKTGGSSIRNLLERNGWVEDKALRIINSHHNCYYEYKDNFIKANPEISFAVVRNPFSRALSHLNQVRRAHCEPGSKIDYNYVIDTMFKTILPIQGYHVDDNHWIPQYTFLNEKSKIFKQELMTPLFSFLKENNIVDIDDEIKILNSHNKKMDYLEVFNDNSKNLIREFYYKDFELFKYDSFEE